MLHRLYEQVESFPPLCHLYPSVLISNRPISLDERDSSNSSPFLSLDRSPFRVLQIWEKIEKEANDGTQLAGNYPAFHERGESSKGNLAERRGNDPGNSNCCWGEKKKKLPNRSFSRFSPHLEENFGRFVLVGFVSKGEGEENLQRLNSGRCVWYNNRPLCAMRPAKSKLDLHENANRV